MSDLPARTDSAADPRGRLLAEVAALPGLPGPDAADALGIAICHAHAGHTLAAIGAASPLARKSHAMYRKGRGY